METSLTPDLASAIHARDRYRCRYCDAHVDDASATLCWIVPARRGGTVARANLVTACPRCAHRQGAHLPGEVGLSLIGATSMQAAFAAARARR